jgi:hypothetical protein
MLVDKILSGMHEDLGSIPSINTHTHTHTHTHTEFGNLKTFLGLVFQDTTFSHFSFTHWPVYLISFSFALPCSKVSILGDWEGH